MAHTKDDCFENLRDSISEFSKSNLTSSEANTKKKIIEPLLECLGWDFSTNEVRLEHPVYMGTGNHYVDYSLNLEGKPVLFFEAKSFDNNLDKNYSRQILSYGRVDDVRWTAISNGRELKIFDSKSGKEETDCLIGEIDLTRLPDGKEILMLIHRDSIMSGEIESMSQRLSETKKAIKKLQQKQNELANRYSEVIFSIIGEKTKNRVEQISEILAKNTVELFTNQAEQRSKPEDIQYHGTSSDHEIKRSNLSNYPEGEVIICPSKPDGVDFLKKYNAWGFIRTSRNPKYLALYVGKPESSLLYFGEIDRITEPINSQEELSGVIDNQDFDTFSKGKQVIWLKPNSLRKFTDPVPLVNKKMGLRGIRYSSLDQLIKAKKIIDV